MVTGITRILISCFLIQVVYSVSWLDPDDRLCLPFDFKFSEEQLFASLAVVPYLDRRPLKDFGLLEIAPINNDRYNNFVSCMWKSRSLQAVDGKIDFDLVARYFGTAIAKHLGETGPAMKLSMVKAAKLVEKCKDLYGSSHGHQVIRVRNCLIPDIKQFQDM